MSSELTAEMTVTAYLCAEEYVEGNQICALYKGHPIDRGPGHVWVSIETLIEAGTVAWHPAILDAARAGEGLDVERLAMALDRLNTGSDGEYAFTFTIDTIEGFAGEVAREYAALHPDTEYDKGNDDQRRKDDSAEPTTPSHVVLDHN